MCYSAQIEADYRKYRRLHGASMDIGEFADLWLRRAERKTPRALDLAFLAGDSPEEKKVAEAIRQADQVTIAQLQGELAAQVERLGAAVAKLASAKPTKKAADDQRIATKKIAQLRGRLNDLRRLETQPKDSRIFPGVYAPVMVAAGGKRVLRPMRYQCRPAGKPAFYDTKYPGTYNARRDNLEGFWKGQFGHTHGLMLVDSFFEHVELPDGKRAVLEFRPDDGEQMLIACLWSTWSDGQEELVSFAAITDDPPPEVAAAGHDRCIIPIKPEHIDAWLNPDPKDLAALYTILDDRPRPYYRHRLAA
jgi:putative SOS response-associated peptidase YedK